MLRTDSPHTIAARHYVGDLCQADSPVPARCSADRVASHAVSAAAQFVDHLLATVERVDVHVAEVAVGVVEADAAHVAEPARNLHGLDGRGLL